MPKGENVGHGVMVLALMSCYGVGIDIKKGHYGQCWTLCYGIGNDVKNGQYG
jgi:hypothetical protein